LQGLACLSCRGGPEVVEVYDALFRKLGVEHRQPSRPVICGTTDFTSASWSTVSIACSPR
jgi:hypothetical protein